MNNQRRKILAGDLGLGSAALMASCSRGPADFEQPKSIPHPRLYDVSNPAENLETFAIVWADLSGKPVWLAATGIIYLIRDGEMPLPLMRVSGLRYTKLERFDISTSDLWGLTSIYAHNVYKGENFVSPFSFYNQIDIHTG